MKKTFGAKIGFVPYASVIIGTYDDTSKDYIMMEETAGKAFSVGKTLMK